MINNLKDEKIVLEIKNLVMKIDSAKEEICIYSDLIKQIILLGSNKN
jgi:hypothetical protein